MGVKEPLPFRPDEAEVNLPTRLYESSALARVRSEKNLPPRATPKSQLTPLRRDATSQRHAQVDCRRAACKTPQVFLDKDCLQDGQSWLDGGVDNVHDSCPHHELRRGRPGGPGGAKEGRGSRLRTGIVNRPLTKRFCRTPKSPCEHTSQDSQVGFQGQSYRSGLWGAGVGAPAPLPPPCPAPPPLSLSLARALFLFLSLYLYLSLCISVCRWHCLTHCVRGSWTAS